MQAKSDSDLQSWARYPRVSTQHATFLERPTVDWQTLSGSLLPRGMGRSYGDVCLNADGVLLLTRRLNQILAFDPETGMIRCECGVTLSELVHKCIPYSWFLPVTPGTQFVTIGGAIANDIHGKNHPAEGSFGRHVRSLELIRSDGARILCSPTSHAEWFRATVGGLGLTGLITQAEIQLRKVPSASLECETERFAGIAQCLELFLDSGGYEHNVAWIDGLHAAHRGFFARANHASASPSARAGGASLRVPFEMPGFAVNRQPIGLFNWLYYHSTRPGKRLVGFAPFFYPLDALADWNRLYGPAGFLQYQYVVPHREAAEVFTELARRTRARGLFSTLITVKAFGTLGAPGLISFPRMGITIAMDFPNTGDDLLKLLDEADGIIASAGGAVYPAKDARMSPAHFQAFFPNHRGFASFVDPRFSSSFWRRVTA